MKNKKTLVIAVTSILVVGVLYFAFKKKKQEEGSDIVNDVEYQDLLKKVDSAKK